MQENFIRFPIIPHEIQLYILSKLLAEDYFHWGLYNESLRRSYKPCPFFLLNKRVNCLISILKIKNKHGKAALQFLGEQHHSQEYLNIVSPLFGGAKLLSDLDEFKKLYDTALIPEDNLVGKIYENHYCNFKKMEKIYKL